ncbi:MAG: hypothetical protein JOY82_06450 [Streptosporangiaceae bacterium]|nr:hypothetical protein [Streptosporangiaceae bacterium]MBV9854151.1 hypothetical protein [Streptosporangiaceae bacterium]
MTEEDARLELLKAELNALHSSIQSLDTIVFQIKGWCVTAALAIGGFAVSSHIPALTLIGMAAVAGFFLVNCQFKMIQRAFIRRNRALAEELRSVGIMQVLKGAGTLEIVGAAVPGFSRPDVSFLKRVRSRFSELGYEASLPNTFSLYLFLFICLIIEAIILFV